MAKKKNVCPPGLGQGSGYYTQEIVKRLENAFRYSHQRPYQLFNDWIRIVEVTLDALPEQLKAVAQTGRLAPDPPETAEVFNEVRARYENVHHPAAQRQVWHSFTEAFALLLESAEPGLWGEGSYGEFDCGYMGPDVLGHVYMTYANSDPSWQAQYFSPFSICLLMAKMTVINGAREVYDRIKAACLHPDNILGQAVVLASLVIPEETQGDPNLHRDYFFNRVLPSCVEFYEPILFNEPAIGSGVIMLAAASQYPEWTVKLNLVRFTGQDIDPTCVRMAKINTLPLRFKWLCLSLTPKFCSKCKGMLPIRGCKTMLPENCREGTPKNAIHPSYASTSDITTSSNDIFKALATAAKTSAVPLRWPDSSWDK